MERVELESRERRRAAEGTRERDLVARAQEGEHEAFDALVRLHYGRIYSTAFRLIGNHEDAEDLAQDCFVKAHRALGWFGGRSLLGSWLRRILIHLVRDRLRARGRRPLSAPFSSEPETRGDAAPPAELGRRELSRLISRAMEELPDHLRIPLVLRTLEGLDYDEISRSTGVTPATARTQVMRARKALRRCLEPHLDSYTGGER